MYWYCVRPRRHKRGRKYLPDLAQPGFAPAEAKRGDSRRDAPRRRDADELPAAGVLQSPGPSSPPKLPPPLPARFQQPMRDSLSPSQSSPQSSPQRGASRISAGARQPRPASDTMSETGRTEMSDLTA